MADSPKESCQIYCCFPIDSSMSETQKLCKLGDVLGVTILSGGKTIRVMVVLLSYFYFATTPTSLYSLAIRRNYTGTCHEESHLGSRRLCGLP
ncbi:hypothetical protein ALC53_06305 [Atta colombica]|uniref:Uncharacterized protein n=1 Tax=Atta colombica TaxID=520822 RepID=A0A195BFU7_9HYME|nr:hypothetical protein ALC53_06305 [Atta colombica]